MYAGWPNTSSGSGAESWQEDTAWDSGGAHIALTDAPLSERDQREELDEYQILAASGATFASGDLPYGAK